MHVLCEVMKRKTVDSYSFIIISRCYNFHVLLCSEYHQKAILTLPIPSLLVPTPDTNGGGGGGPPAISETLGPMNLKFCRALKTSLNVSEI